MGLGAVGGLIAARMAAAGHSVSALARGETLARVRERGLVVDSAGKRSVARIVVAEEARTLGLQDLVVIALKAPAAGKSSLCFRPCRQLGRVRQATLDQNRAGPLLRWPV